MNTTTTKSPKVRTAPAISVSAEGFSGKVREALLKSVSQGVGEVRVKVADPDDRPEVRKVQKRVQGIGYGSGFNANFRVTLTGDILTGKVVDLTRETGKPGQTAPTAKTPGTRNQFEGWSPAKITAWKNAHPVNAKKGDTKVTTKGTAKRTPVRKVTKVTAKVPTVTPDALKGVSGGPVDTKTVTTRKVSPKVTK